jgi:uncharacterized protein YndB with AHSA1/START domain
MEPKVNALSAEASARLGAVGKLEDGRDFVVFERLLPHSIETVWAAITEPAQIEKWFPGFRLELAQGGRFDFWFGGGNCEGPSHVNGVVTRYEPPTVLECGSMRYELESRGTGTILRFSDILHYAGPRSKAEFCNSVLGGWHRYLDALGQALAGRVVNHGAAEFDYSTIDVPGRSD